MELVGAIPEWKCISPDGAFYIFPQVNGFFGKRAGDEQINTSTDLCMYLVNHAHVSTVSGSAFGNDNCIRISFANSMEKIELAFSRIYNALDRLR
jgi:aspartate aminotransferase